MVYADGSEYVGQWVKDKREGRGTMTWKTPEGVASYEGEWLNDFKSGHGRY